MRRSPYLAVTVPEPLILSSSFIVIDAALRYLASGKATRTNWWQSSVVKHAAV
jgi:hypothetical protein